MVVPGNTKSRLVANVRRSSPDPGPGRGPGPDPLRRLFPIVGGGGRRRGSGVGGRGWARRTAREPRPETWPRPARALPRPRHAGNAPPHNPMSADRLRPRGDGASGPCGPASRPSTAATARPEEPPGTRSGGTPTTLVGAHPTRAPATRSPTPTLGPSPDERGLAKREKKAGTGGEVYRTPPSRRRTRRDPSWTRRPEGPGTTGNPPPLSRPL